MISEDVLSDRMRLETAIDHQITPIDSQMSGRRAYSGNISKRRRVWTAPRIYPLTESDPRRFQDL